MVKFGHLHGHPGFENVRDRLLPSHYLEMVKSRLYDDDEAAAWTLHRIVISWRLLAPFALLHPPHFKHGVRDIMVDVDLSLGTAHRRGVRN